MNDRYDVLIVGGGLVGLSMALALEPLSLKVALIDRFGFDPNKKTSAAYDDRCIALSYGSRLIYQGMNIWSQLQNKVTAIKHIHVSDRGHFGVTRLHAKQESIDALGYVVESRVLGHVLYQALHQSTLDIIAPAKVTQLRPLVNDNKVTLLQNGQQRELSAYLVIAADGSNSFIRQQLPLSYQQSDYQQTALIANVSTSQAHQNWAYERFTANGPLALLPLSNQHPHTRLSLVWTHTTTQVDSTMALNDQDFLEALNAMFGYRLGRFIKVGKRSCYPLHLMKSTQDVYQNVVLIGNASHTLHPVAGQGLNLGLRDIATLVDLLVDHKTLLSSHISKVLQNYQAMRHPDYQTVINYTHRLVHLFSNDAFPLPQLRSTGLLAVDRIAPLRRLLAQQNMGLNFRQSRLARGLAVR